MYRDEIPGQFDAIRKGAKERNISLINEIETALKIGKKVYVVAGTAHLIKISDYDDGSDLVKEALKKHKFAIITKKTSFGEVRSDLNSDLKIQPSI